MSKHSAKARCGSANGQWKSGVAVHTKGYLRISAGPLRGVYVHTLVAEAKLGRPLNSDEQVHHLDGDRLNCRPENLQVVPASWNIRGRRGTIVDPADRGVLEGA